MKPNNHIFKKYYKQIRNALPCSGKKRKKILQCIQANVTDYLHSHPDATTEDVEQHFGSAQTIASAYLDTEDRDTILNNLRTRKIIKRSIIAVAAVVILLWGAIVGWVAIEEWTSVNGYITDVIYEKNP